MSTNRFDQRADEPYGHCQTCAEAGTELPFATKEEMSAHLHETFEAGQGHTGWTTNPIRPERIRSHISFAIQDAIYEFLEDVEHDLDREDFTAEEVTEALRGSPDFHEAWLERDQL